jgi:SPP1 family predicted phage head-tail adaptor
MIDPGRLKTRLLIEAPTDADDGQGGVVRSFSALATVWAAVLPAGMHHQQEADADGAAVRLRVILRHGVALTTRHRLVDGGRIYRINALREIDDRRFIEIDAAWRID